MLSDAERTDARRYLGYPARGSDGSGELGFQFYQVDGAVEFRLDHLSGAEEVVLRQFLGTLHVLEQAIPAVGATLDTGAAAGWTRNPAELSDRMRLFDDWRRRFCSFLGLPPGEGLAVAGSSLKLVV